MPGGRVRQGAGGPQAGDIVGDFLAHPGARARRGRVSPADPHDLGDMRQMMLVWYAALLAAGPVPGVFLGSAAISEVAFGPVQG
jgi:hypothetical protein